MAEIDYLNQRTTNINIRISPMLKTQLIDYQRICYKILNLGITWIGYYRIFYL
jgi:hypothetical protein